MPEGPLRPPMASISDPKELWEKVVKWSLAAFLVTAGVFILLGILTTV